MTQEEEQLLFKDLCARLPYGVKYYLFDIGDLSEKLTLKELSTSISNAIESGFIIPYLRPMSSMTEEEREEYKSLFTEREEEYNQGCAFFYSYTLSMYDHQNIAEVVDWLNKHHFDYRGLIPMGLALEAPKDMYKIV